MGQRFWPLLFIGTILWGQGIFAMERIGRLGVGVSGQLKNNFPATSIKFQQSRSLAIGGLLALSTDSGQGGYGMGLKLYRMIFDEPQLNFYLSLMGGLLKETQGAVSSSGFQLDFTAGSEFSFAGISSLGMSFEFGLSLRQMDEFIIETVGNHFVTAGIHFYI